MIMLILGIIAAGYVMAISYTILIGIVAIFNH